MCSFHADSDIYQVNLKMIDVCVCTHNPRADVFQIILQAIANQTIDRTTYQVWIIDNASNPPISSADLAVLTTAGIAHQTIFESNLGIMYARRRAIESTHGELLIFVDDDNELDVDYLATAVEIANSHPDFGCFGGKLLLSAKAVYPQWVEPMLPYLAIKDLGDTELTNCADTWGLWEPPTAGMVARRSILKSYLDRLDSLPKNLLLGRKGKQGLLSSEDSLIARGAYHLGLSCSYQPKLKLTHHLDPKRFQFLYIMKLVFCYGRSNILLDRALSEIVPPMSIKEVYDFAIPRIESRWEQANSIKHFLCTLAWDIGYIYERQQSPAISPTSR
jgi:glycosyltransferase involved in cell wall biosynthesis